MKNSSRFSTRSLMLVISLSVLAIVLVACAPAATPAPSNSITGIVWQWTTVTDQGKTTTVPNPENYTIIFNTDGTLNGKADCNTFNGVYSQQNGFTIKAGRVHDGVLRRCLAGSTVHAIVEQCRGGRSGWRWRSGVGNGGRRAAHGVQERRRSAKVASSVLRLRE